MLTVTNLSGGTATDWIVNYTVSGRKDIGILHATNTVNEIDKIVYTFKDKNGCTFSPAPEYWVNPPGHRGAGTSLTKETTTLKISPNPSMDLFTIEIPGVVNAAQLIVTDISGKVVDARNTTENVVVLDMGKTPAGTYLITVFSGGERYTEKMVKE